MGGVRDTLSVNTKGVSEEDTQKGLVWSWSGRCHTLAAACIGGGPYPGGSYPELSPTLPNTDTA